MRYFLRVARTIRCMIFPQSIIQVPPGFPQLPLIPFSCPIRDPEIYTFVKHLTTFNPALGYPIFHAVEDNCFHWFANPQTQELLYHTLAVSGSAGSIGIVEVIALPNGSATVGPLAAFNVDKFAFVLAWVSIYRHSMYSISRFVQVIIEMRDVALRQYTMSHAGLDSIRLEHVANCATQLSQYFTDVLSMSNSSIAAEDAVAAKDALTKWFNISLVG